MTGPCCLFFKCSFIKLKIVSTAFNLQFFCKKKQKQQSLTSFLKSCVFFVMTDQDVNYIFKYNHNEILRHVEKSRFFGLTSDFLRQKVDKKEALGA